jgi:hypothetical protein
MKRVYNLLGAQPGGLGHRLRNVLEFRGGVTDNYLHPARAGVDVWNTDTRGTTPAFRVPPGSNTGAEQPRIPAATGARLKYSVGYYSHDSRRLAQDASFEFDAKTAASAAPPRRAELGSLGNKNPDVSRYDASGLRTAMTTSWTALRKELAKARPNHLPAHASAKAPLAEDAAVARALAAQGALEPGRVVPRAKVPYSNSYRHADQW